MAGSKNPSSGRKGLSVEPTNQKCVSQDEELSVEIVKEDESRKTKTQKTASKESNRNLVDVTPVEHQPSFEMSHQQVFIWALLSHFSKKHFRRKKINIKDYNWVYFLIFLQINNSWKVTSIRIVFGLNKTFFLHILIKITFLLTVFCHSKQEVVVLFRKNA